MTLWVQAEPDLREEFPDPFDDGAADQEDEAEPHTVFDIGSGGGGGGEA